MTQWGHGDPTPVDTPNTGDGKLMVAVRVRPLQPEEGTRVVHALNDKTVILEEPPPSGSRARGRGPSRQYMCDKVFDEDATQEEVYSATTRPLVDAVLRGYNATVFAYGATGAGKTHTMVGPGQGEGDHSPSHQGVMVRALNELFGQAANPGDKVTLSYLEIYNENIRDLLNPSSGHLELREDSQGGVRVAGLTETDTRSASEVLQLLHRGNRERTVEPTAANRASSRSHALLSVRLTRPSARVRGLTGASGRLFMIDLAGSERAANTKNRGKRLQEGAHINRSLLALGNCINALAGGARYVNFRDSKLTRLLKDALTGDCRAVMIAHVSPAARHSDETRNTLAYAHRAGTITARAGQYRDIVSDLRGEIARLRTKIAEGELAAAAIAKQGECGKSTTATQNAEGCPGAKAAAAASADPGAKGGSMVRLRDQLVTAFREQMRLRRALLDIDAQLLRLDSETDRLQMVLSRASKLYQGPVSVDQQSSVSQSRGRSRGRRTASTAVGADHDSSDEESNSPSGSPTRRALHALEAVDTERSRLVELRTRTERDLESKRGEAARLEDALPLQASSSEERELLSLVLRVHELEAERLALQGERELRRHELRRRDLLLMRYDRQRHICDEIITRQRRLIEDGHLSLPADLHDLYRLYQKEIHAAAYATFSPYSAYGLMSSAYGSLGSTFTADTAGGTRGLYTAVPEVPDPETRPPSRRDELPAIQRGERMFRRTKPGPAARGARTVRGGTTAGDSGSRSSARSPNSSTGSEWEVATFPSMAGQRRPADTASGPSKPVQFPPISGPRGDLRRAISTDNVPTSAERQRRASSPSPPAS